MNQNQAVDSQADGLLSPVSKPSVTSGETEESDEKHGHLPPLVLQVNSKSRPENPIFFIFIVLTGLGTVIGFLVAKSRAANPMISTCSGRVASQSEKRFLINTSVVTGISFSHAKLLDVAWDTIVGQGGRFLHAWMLYHVGAQGLTWMLERTALPYRFQIDLLFSTASARTLVSIIRLSFFGKGQKSTRLVLWTTWLIFSIAYVMAFASVWDTATGYVNPASPAYPLINNAFVTRDSNTLQLCWVGLDFNRVGLESPVLGPTFAEILPNVDMSGNFSSPLYDPTNELWGNSTNTKDNDFASLYAYVLTKRYIQTLYMSSGSSFNFSVNNISLNLPINPALDNSFSWESNSTFTTFFNQSEGFAINLSKLFNEFAGARMNRLSPIVHGFEFLGPGETGAVPKEIMDNLNTTQKSSLTDSLLAYNTSFKLDTKIQSGPGIVPYNSTLWYNSSRVHIPAPFLQFDNTDCSWFQNDLSACLCFNGQPITTDWRNTDNLKCINDDNNYTWGFSSFMSLVGMCLETAWLFGCWCVWWQSNRHSNLLVAKRTGVGIVRNMLDLGEAINRDLGPHTCLYSENYLWESLEKCKPIRYMLSENDDGMEHIGLAPESAASTYIPKFTSGRVYG